MIEWFADLLPLAASVSEDSSYLGDVFFKAVLIFRIALGIGLVIFVHELGHFVAAKTFGVKCEKFYVGFDVPIKIGPLKLPRTLGKFRYGETEYGIGVIPLGGYVKMLGQDDDPRKQEAEAKRIRVDGEESNDAEVEPAAAQLDPRSFPAKPVWQRMIIISAGVVMNVITGVLFAAMAYGYGISYNPAVVGGVTPGGPAWQAGIEPGGRLVSVGTWSDPNMHFREMRMEILTKGLESPEDPINVAIQYDNGTRDFSLKTQPDPRMKDARMIGLAVPYSSKIGSTVYARRGSVAEDVFTEQDAGAEIVSFNGTSINQDSIVPVTPMLSYLYTHPSEPVDLRLKRKDGSEHDVTLPPQPSRSLGLRYGVGPIVALVDDGPAAKAGMLVGDRIVQVNDNTTPDAYGLALQLVGVTEPVTVVVERGAEANPEQVTLEITPEASPQTMPPTDSIGGEIAVNAVGFAYNPLPTIVGVLNGDSGEEVSASEAETLQSGDVVKWVRLDAEVEGPSDPEESERFDALVKELREKWSPSEETPLTGMRAAIRLLPDGTPLTVAVERGDDKSIVTTTINVRNDGRYLFDRGLVLDASSSIQKASSVPEALSLGLREGYRRLTDVVRFLKMIPRGRIKLRHVGGPLEIVNIAKNEAEKGIAPQLMFLIYELVAGKRANEQLEFRLTVAGLLTLLMLMAVVFANDILRHL